MASAGRRDAGVFSTSSTGAAIRDAAAIKLDLTKLKYPAPRQQLCQAPHQSPGLQVAEGASPEGGPR